MKNHTPYWIFYTAISISLIGTAVSFYCMVTATSPSNFFMNVFFVCLNLYWVFKNVSNLIECKVADKRRATDEKEYQDQIKILNELFTDVQKERNENSRMDQ